MKIHFQVLFVIGLLFFSGRSFSLVEAFLWKDISASVKSKSAILAVTFLVAECGEIILL